MKKIMISLLVLCVMCLAPQNVFAGLVQLNEMTGAKKFVTEYNECCDKHGYNQVKITKYYDEGIGDGGLRYHTCYYGYSAIDDGVGCIFMATNAAGYISWILVDGERGEKSTNQAINATLAVVSGLDNIPSSIVSDYWRDGKAYFYSDVTKRNYHIFHDLEWEYRLQHYHVIHVEANDGQ